MRSAKVVVTGMDFPNFLSILSVLCNASYIFSIFSEHGIDTSGSMAFCRHTI